MLVEHASLPLPHTVDTLVEAALERLARRSGPRGERAASIVEAAAQTASGGKRLRPRLVLESFRAFSGGAAPTPAAVDTAAGFELLHTAFVIHDDVIDRAVERRGRPNVSGVFRAGARAAGAGADRAAQFGDAASILAGDVLLYEATRLIACAELPSARRRRLLDLMDDVIMTSAAGELADVEYAALPSAPSPEALLAVARDKTAVYSFSAPLQAGALLAGAPDASLDALAAAGESLGLAFQLADVLVGAFGTAQQAGRPAGSDLREGRQTVLLALARRDPSWPGTHAALAAAGSGAAGLRDAQEALEASGARRQVELLLDLTLTASRTVWSRSPIPEAAKGMLNGLADTVRERVP